MNANNAKVLVAEDNPINQKVVLGILAKLGFTADIAFNGEEVLAALEEKDYSLIFMDCQMPGIDGYEATQKIRQAGSEIPIIALTANAMPGDKEKCIESGMNDYLPKPLHVNEIEAMLKKYI